MYPRCKRHQGIEAVLLTQIILFSKKLTKLVESSTDEEKDGGHDEGFVVTSSFSDKINIGVVIHLCFKDNNQVIW